MNSKNFSHRSSYDPSPIPLLPFVWKHLLHPKTRRGAVEQPEQGEVIVLGGVGGQLDDRGRPIEHLAAAVEHEVVVSRDEGEGDRKRDAVACQRKNIKCSYQLIHVLRSSFPNIIRSAEAVR